MMKSIVENKKGFLQMSFPWIFALLVGAVIIFLAIYGVSKLISTQETIQSAKTSKEIGILLNPLETGFQEFTTVQVGFPVETRIYNKCNLEGEFGRQLIQVSQKSLNKWTETDIDVGFSNKYIFSRAIVEGKNMLIFTKPFEFPFKVADLTYMTSASDDYCFMDAPEEIREELSNLGQKNIIVDNCSIEDEDMIKICFGKSSSTSECNTIVNYGGKYVEKSSGRSYFYDDSLMYAAIFADNAVYECQLKRLMKKTAILSELYIHKIDFIGCGSTVLLQLLSISSMTRNLDESQDLILMKDMVENADKANREASSCRLW